MPRFNLVWTAFAGVIALMITLPGGALKAAPNPTAPVSANNSVNYVQRLGQRAVWSAFPLRVYFVHDANHSPERERAARDGFSRWTEATSGFVRYEVVNAPARANITVRFVTNTNDGLTGLRFWKGRIKSADVSLGVEDQETSDLECIAAHEFGHALGINGHSRDENDLMYPIHWAGHTCRITNRDLNTLETLYPALAKNTVTAHQTFPLPVATFTL